MGYSQKNRSAFVMDIVIGSVWLLLIAHESVSDWLVAPFLILYPVLRIWTSFLLHRRSGLVVAPIILLSLLTIVALVNTALSYTLFIEPWITLISTASAAFDLNVRDITSSSIAIIGDYRYTIPVGLISSIWLIGLPWAMCVYARVKKLFFPSRLGGWGSFGLCTYILVIVVLDVIILYHSYNITLGVALQVLMVLLIPIIFYRGSVKHLFSRSEVAYLLTIALFAIGYACGIGLELKSVVTVCLLPAAFYALANWYVRRETTYRDILLVVGASIVFWSAQYTTNMVRISMLLLSLALMAVEVIRFAIEAKKN